jgi:hypothetical protein
MKIDNVKYFFIGVLIMECNPFMDCTVRQHAAGAAHKGAALLLLENLFSSKF